MYRATIAPVRHFESDGIRGCNIEQSHVNVDGRMSASTADGHSH